jgi:hypothetical protein
MHIMLLVAPTQIVVIGMTGLKIDLNWENSTERDCSKTRRGAHC